MKAVGKGVRADRVRRRRGTGATQPARQLTAIDRERRSDLYAALTAATNNPTAQLGLIYVYANRLGCGEADVEAVKQLINASSECAG